MFRRYVLPVAAAIAFCLAGDWICAFLVLVVLGSLDVAMKFLDEEKR
jgi:hypothetical protein